ncbi:hypothetical protein PR048_025826 [Dryococelus australis]|uniref:Uncharacterized protein n=1 Tax=Dryococelus australis TaxID=614101 RepID=A0ABQ9GJP4_9NEOP|nr:hypothetical protein PR048_025826 [Dryococelus australis]
MLKQQEEKVWSGAGMKGRRKREIPEKTRRPMASSGTIPNPRPGIEPGSPWWEASVRDMWIFRAPYSQIMTVHLPIYMKAWSRRYGEGRTSRNISDKVVLAGLETRVKQREGDGAEDGLRRGDRIAIDCRSPARNDLSTKKSRRWFDYSPPTWANRVRCPAEPLPDLRMRESCLPMLLVSGFSRGSPVSLPLHSSAAPYLNHLHRHSRPRRFFTHSLQLADASARYSQFPPPPPDFQLTVPAHEDRGNGTAAGEMSNEKMSWRIGEKRNLVRNGNAAVSLLVSHHVQPGSIPGWASPGFSYVGIVPDDAAGRRGFLGDLPFPRPCIPAPLHSHLALHRLTLSLLRHSLVARGCENGPHVRLVGLASGMLASWL